MSILVFANGDLQAGDWLLPYLQDASVIIAADGGANHLRRLARVPDVLIGDLDSLQDGVLEELKERQTEIVDYAPEKDETDLELAMLFAVSQYDEDVLVVGGLGGRLDQMFANILLLMHPQLRGKNISFKTEYQRIWLIAGETTIKGESGDTVSLIPIGGDVFVQSTSGLKWRLENERLAFGPARGVSNEMLGTVAHISIRSGYLLCVHTRRVWQR